MESKIVEIIKELNHSLNNHYSEFDKFTKEEWKNIFDRIGSRYFVKSMNKKELSEIKSRGGVLSTDASSNHFGGAYPHFVTIFRGVSLSTIKKEEIFVETDIYSPLLEYPLETSVEESRSIEDKRLAAIEIEVTLKALEECTPAFLLMDGSLIRFAILQPLLWEKLKSTVLERGIILAGVIEEIKTSILYEILDSEGLVKTSPFYDREALFNQLDIGEALVLHDTGEGKSEYGFTSSFLRSSRDPNIIGVDLLTDQKLENKRVLSLILALTDENSRGIPLLLDYVDAESRITHKMMEELLELYLEPKHYERLFRSQRSKRIY